MRYAPGRTRASVSQRHSLPQDALAQGPGECPLRDDIDPSPKKILGAHEQTPEVEQASPRQGPDQEVHIAVFPGVASAMDPKTRRSVTPRLAARSNSAWRWDWISGFIAQPPLSVDYFDSCQPLFQGVNLTGRIGGADEAAAMGQHYKSNRIDAYQPHGCRLG